MKRILVPILTGIILLAMVLSTITFCVAAGIYAYEKSEYIETNSNNLGIVTDKTQETDEYMRTKYYVTIQWQSLNYNGEPTTETKTYTITFDNWSDIKVGHIATMDKSDGTVTVTPPVEGEPLPEQKPVEPFGSFTEYVSKKTDIAIPAIVHEYFSDEDNIGRTICYAIFICAATFGLHVLVVNIADAWNDKYDEEYEEDEDDEYEDDEYDECDEDSDDATQEEGNSDPFIRAKAKLTQRDCTTYAETLQPQQSNDSQGTILQAPNHRQTMVTQDQPTRLTVHQIRTVADSMMQIEITENYQSLASGNKYSLTEEYDDHTVTKLSIETSLYTTKLVLDITQKTF